MVSIFQTDSGVANLNWFGANNELIWCASMTRGVSVWNSISGDRIACINDFYPLLSEKGSDASSLERRQRGRLCGRLHRPEAERAVCAVRNAGRTGCHHPHRPSGADRSGVEGSRGGGEAGG